MCVTQLCSPPHSKVTPTDTLSVSVWDWDRIGKSEFLGQVELPLASLDLSQLVDQWYPLTDQQHGQHPSLTSSKDKSESDETAVGHSPTTSSPTTTSPPIEPMEVPSSSDSSNPPEIRSSSDSSTQKHKRDSIMGKLFKGEAKKVYDT